VTPARRVAPCSPDPRIFHLQFTAPWLSATAPGRPLVTWDFDVEID